MDIELLPNIAEILDISNTIVEQKAANRWNVEETIQRERNEEKKKIPKQQNRNKLMTYVTLEDIEKAVKPVKKLTGGWPQQVVQWMMR